MTDETRRERGRAAAQGLVDELMTAEKVADNAVYEAKIALSVALSDGATARRAARSEWLKWRGYGLAPLVWAEDAGGTEPGAGGEDDVE